MYDLLYTVVLTVLLVSYGSRSSCSNLSPTRLDKACSGGLDTPTGKSSLVLDCGKGAFVKGSIRFGASSKGATLLVLGCMLPRSARATVPNVSLATNSNDCSFDKNIAASANATFRCLNDVRAKGLVLRLSSVAVPRGQLAVGNA